MGTNNKNPRNSRREFLKAASKLAVYTPPAMMVLANPSLAQVAQSGGRTTTTIPVTITDDEIQSLFTLGHGSAFSCTAQTRQSFVVAAVLQVVRQMRIECIAVFRKKRVEALQCMHNILSRGIGRILG